MIHKNWQALSRNSVEIKMFSYLLRQTFLWKWKLEGARQVLCMASVLSPPYLSNTLTNLCRALCCILLYCVVLNCIVFLIYCYVDIIQYNALHKFVGVLDNP